MAGPSMVTILVCSYLEYVLIILTSMLKLSASQAIMKSTVTRFSLRPLSLGLGCPLSGVVGQFAPPGGQNLRCGAQSVTAAWPKQVLQTTCNVPKDLRHQC